MHSFQRYDDSQTSGVQQQRDNELPYSTRQTTYASAYRTVSSTSKKKGGGCCFKCGYFSTAVWLIIFNGISFLVGIAIIGLAIYVLTSSYRDDVDVLADDYDYNLSLVLAVIYSMVVLAALLVLFATTGLFGSCCQSKSIFKFYILLIVLSLAALGVTCYFTVSGKGDTDDWINGTLRPRLQAYFDDFAALNIQPDEIPSQPPSGVDLEDVSDIQKAFDCCGVNGIVDYIESGLPVSWTEGCEGNENIGCVSKTEDYLNDGFWIAVYALIVFGSLMVVNIGLTIFIIYGIKKRRRASQDIKMRRRSGGDAESEQPNTIEITFPDAFADVISGPSEPNRPPPYNTSFGQTSGGEA
eukprot:Nk52_evm3s2241 gene=Nk52_evmTU3s2241